MTGQSNDANATAYGNIIEASIPVQYRVPREQLKNGWLNFKNPEALLRDVAYREVSAYFLRNNLRSLLEAGTEDSLEVKNRIQKAVKEAGMEVEILFVGLKGIRPPAESPTSIKGDHSEEQTEDPSDKPGSDLSKFSVGEVIGMRDANRVAGEAEISKANNTRKFEEFATKIGVAQQGRRVADANATAHSNIRSRASVVEMESPLFEAAPGLYKEWRYLQTFNEAVARARKYVIAVGPNVEVQIDLDLQKSLRPDIFNSVPGSGGGPAGNK